MEDNKPDNLLNEKKDRLVYSKVHPCKKCLGCGSISFLGNHLHPTEMGFRELEKITLELLQEVEENAISEKRISEENRGINGPSSGYLSLACFNQWRSSIGLPPKKVSTSMSYLSCITKEPNPHYNKK